MKKQKTWENLEVNDLIQDSDGDKRIILDFSLNKKVVFLYYRDKYDLYRFDTLERLKDMGYTIVQDKEEEVNKEDLKKLIEETKYFFNEMLDTEIELKYREIRDLLAKWKGVEVEKIKYIK